MLAFKKYEDGERRKCQAGGEIETDSSANRDKN